MPSSTETAITLAWIESTLTNDQTLQGYAPGGILQTFPLPGTTTPYMIVRFLSGKDYPVFGGGRAYSDMRFRVIVVGPIANQQTLASAAARVETLLTVTSATSVTGGTIIGSFRDQPASNDEWVDSGKWSVVGGEYCIMAKAS
jgi:hypothetical protein